MTKNALENDDVLSLDEASQYLHIKRRTLYVLAARGAVPGAKIGGQWRFLRSQLLGLFEEGQPPPDLRAIRLEADRRTGRRLP